MKAKSGKPNMSKVKRFLARKRANISLDIREICASMSEPANLAPTYKDRSLRAALPMELKDHRIKLPQTNCLWRPKYTTHKYNRP
jgi:hypothetical protein